MDKDNTKGRRKNDAAPLGSRPGIVSDRETERVGREERRTAGPDGPDARAVGDTFKAPK